MNRRFVSHCLGLCLCPVLILGVVFMFYYDEALHFEKMKAERPAEIICSNTVVYCKDYPWAPCCNDTKSEYVYCYDEKNGLPELRCIDITKQCKELRASANPIVTDSLILFFDIFPIVLLILGAIIFMINAGGIFRLFYKVEKITELPVVITHIETVPTAPPLYSDLKRPQNV